MANVAKIEICFQQHLCSKARHQASDGEYLSGYNMIANPLPHLLAGHFFIFNAAPSKVVTMACIYPSLVM
jgi:hypothetical protein